MKVLVVIVKCVNIFSIIMTVVLLPFMYVEDFDGFQGVTWLLGLLNLPLSYNFIMITSGIVLVTWLLTYFLLKYFSKKGY